MPAYDNVLRDHIDANEANARRVIARAEDLRSPGWLLSCQWLIPSASHRFPFFFFFPPRDLISIPTQSFRILSSFLPHLPLLLFLLCQPISSGSSGNDANYRKEADVTAKHPVMGRNPLVPSPLFSSCLSPADSSHSRLISYISDTLKASIFAILLVFFLCPTAFLLLRTSHYFQKITHFGLSDV